jgi:nucleoid DNA-binding protein
MALTWNVPLLAALDVASPAYKLQKACTQSGHCMAKSRRSIHLEKIMNKAELIEALAKETDMSKAAAGRAVSALVDIITKSVAKKQDVQLIGFGTFKAAKRAARVGKNPRTGEKLKIAAATVPRFTAGAAFKAAVNKKK